MNAFTTPSTEEPGQLRPLDTSSPTPPASVLLLGAALVGGLVSISLGVYANVHEPTGQSIANFGFSSTLAMKAWSTTAAGALVIVQILSALALYGRLPGVTTAPAWTGALHRWSGTAAFLLTLPVAYHCLWSLGFRSTDTRVLIHSILGCAFYGIFTTKMLVLRSSRLPEAALPLAGGLLATVLAAIWTTSSWWYFTTIGFPAF